MGGRSWSHADDTGYRTVLAPGSLVDENLHHVLAESTGASGVGADGARVVELDNPQVGKFSIGYTSEQLARGVIDVGASASGELLTDEHGRPLEIVYGVVSRDTLDGPLDAEDLRTARTHALQSYRSYLTDEEGHRVEVSVPFALRTRGRAGTVSGSTSAIAHEVRPWAAGQPMGSISDGGGTAAALPSRSPSRSPRRRCAPPEI